MRSQTPSCLFPSRGAAVTALRVTLAFLALAACRPGLAQSRYVITDVGTLPAGGRSTPNSLGYGVNAAGQVAGKAKRSDGYEHAFRWSPGRGMEDLGTLGGDRSEARGINGGGQVCGTSWIATGSDGHHERGVVHTPGLGMAPLESPFGLTTSAAAINDAGQVCGSFHSGVSGTRAALWTGSHMLDLGTLPGGAGSHARGINSHGHVVGASDRPGAVSSAFLWTPEDGMRELPPHHSAATLWPGDYCAANAVNDAGVVVGETRFLTHANDKVTVACRWVAGAPEPLGTLPDHRYSRADAVNRAGVIVGVSRGGPSNTERAVAWYPGGGGPVDLNSVVTNGGGWVLRRGTAINERGEIAGFGDLNGYTHAFLLTPVDASGIGLYARDEPSVTDRVVDGIVCDNLARVAAPGWTANTLTVRLDGYPGATGSVTTLSQPGLVGPVNNVGGITRVSDTEFTYTPPDEFSRDPRPSGAAGVTKEATRKVRLTVSFLDGGGTRREASRDIVLARPPVVLVHGINSGPDRWVPLMVQAQLGRGVRVPLVRVDHSDADGGNGPVEVGAARLREAMDSTLRRVRYGSPIPQAAVRLDSQGGVVPFFDWAGLALAARRVDVVAWSYGGVITRWYVQSRGLAEAPRGWPWYTRVADNQGLTLTQYGGDIRKIITLGSMWRGVPLCNYINQALLQTDGPVRFGDAPFYVGDNIRTIVRALPIPTEAPSMEVMAADSKWLRQMVYGDPAPDAGLPPRPFDPCIAYGSVAGDDQNYPVSLGESLPPARLNVYGDIDFFQQPSWFPYLRLEQIASTSVGRHFHGRSYSDGIVPVWSAAIPGSYKIAPVTHDAYADDRDTCDYVLQWLGNAELPLGQELNRTWQDESLSSVSTLDGGKAWQFTPASLLPYPQSDLYGQTAGGFAGLKRGAWGGVAALGVRLAGYSVWYFVG